MRAQCFVLAALVAGFWSIRCGTETHTTAANGSGGSPGDAGSGIPPAGNADAGSSADAGSGPADAGVVTHTLRVRVIGSGRVRSSPAGIDCGPSCSATFADGTSVSLSATPDSGWTFTGWSGDCAGSGGCSLTTSSDKDVSATFSAVTPPDECAALRPPDPGPARGRHTIQSLGDCQAGIGDGNGTLALSISNVLPPSNAALHFVSPAGDLLASYPGTNADLTGQLSGFEGQVWAGGSGEHWFLRAWDTKGATVTETPPFANAPEGIKEDPLGGVVVWRFETPVVFESYDEHLKLRWRVPMPPGNTRDPGDFAVDRAGRMLALFGGDAPKTTDGMWIEHDGTAGPVFHLGPQPDWTHLVGFTLTQRMDTGLFIARGDSWIGQFDSGGSTVLPPPDWLKARPQTRLHMVHGGTGYAVMSPETNHGCTQTLEVIAPSGKSCGSATFSGASASCSSANTTVGYDGTVILEFSEAFDQCHPGGTCTCTWQWWSGFFR